MTQGLKDQIGPVCGGTPRYRARCIDQTPISRTSSGPAARTRRVKQAAYMSAPNLGDQNPFIKAVASRGPSIHDQTPISRTSSGPAARTRRVKQAAYMSAPNLG